MLGNHATAGEGATQAISRRLAERIGHHTFDMWFGDTTRLVVEGTRVSVAAESRFVADWIDHHFREHLDGAVRDALGDRAEVDLRVAPEAFGRAPAAADGARRARRPEPRRRQALRRLEDFVVGDSNRLAFAAARRAAAGAGGAESPLFLYGECGVGKTHLLQGVVQRAGRPGHGARYLTAEQFTNEYIGAVRAGALDRFRKRMRALDVLAADDVQFLSNKTATQNEFLHTIDAIKMAGGRLVLCSDEHPLRLGFGQALGSRFVAGMVARIERPDRATRMALIERLAASRGLRLTAAAAEAVAGRCAGSVRELEGAVNKLAALRLVSEGAGAEVGLVLVEQLFRDGTWRPRAPLRVDTVLEVVCDQLNVSRADIMGSGRHRRVVTARGLVAFLARDLTTLSYPEIAHSLGRRHHSTVHTAVARITEQLKGEQRIDVGGNGRHVNLGEVVDRLRHAVLKAARR